MPGTEDQDTSRLLNNLITRVKHDVSQSILMNQSRINQSRLARSNLYGDVTDMTNDSGFPNITNEELHITRPQNYAADETTQNVTGIGLVQ